MKKKRVNEMELKSILKNLPEVKAPVEKKLSFNVKLKWTIIILAAFFVLANIVLYGVQPVVKERFEFFSIIMGTDFGSIITLGIGPIVMASIILQLLVGSGILNIDLKTEEGKKFFQGLQKLLVFAFIIFEAVVFVLMKGVEAVPGYTGIVIIQLILGGLVIMFMDEVVTKWGFGSGVSLFIVAGVGWRIFASLFQFMIRTPGGDIQNCLADFANTSCAGKILVLIQSFINQDPTGALLAASVLIMSVVVFLGVVWAQSLKVNIPLSYDRLRGYGIKWPLAFFYCGVIPVILTGALIANIQLFGSLLENIGYPILGHFSQGQAVSGLAYWLGSSDLIENTIRGSLTGNMLLQGLTHILIFVGFSVLFSVFWVKTSGQDASTQAKNIMSSGLQISGFRKDERVLESILARYVMPLTIMGGAAIGLLAAAANLLGTLVGGTSMLLAIMIIYQLYTNIAQQHSVDMHPAIRKFIG